MIQSKCTYKEITLIILSVFFGASLYYSISYKEIFNILLSIILFIIIVIILFYKYKYKKIDYDEDNYNFAVKVFKQEEGRSPNMNNIKDMNAVAMLEVGIRYARNKN